MDGKERKSGGEAIAAPCATEPGDTAGNGGSRQETASELEPAGSPISLPCAGTWPRPLFWLTVAFASGIGSSRLVSPLFSLSILPPLIALIYLMLRRALRERAPDRSCLLRLPVLPLLAFFGLGAIAAASAAPELPCPARLDPFFDRPSTLFVAEICAPAEIYLDKIQIPLKLHRAIVDSRAIPLELGATVALSSAGSTKGPWLIGDRLLLRLTLKRFHNFDNPGGFDYMRSQAEKGFYARAHLSDDRFVLKIEPGEGTFPGSVTRTVKSSLDRFRQEALAWLRRSLHPDAASFYAALLLGYRIPQDWAEHLNRAGVSHLLSISGLHLALVCMVVYWAARWAVRLLLPSILQRTSDQHIAMWAGLGAAMLYALISGMALPTWRSVLMLVLFFGAALRYRPSDSLSALAAAALLILAASPNSLWQISFQLSFAAMFGLFMIYPRFRRFQELIWNSLLPRDHLARKLLHPFAEAFWASLAATVSVLPLIAYHFNGISAAGLLANTVLVPAVGYCVLQPGLAGLGLFALSEHLGLPLLKIGEWFLDFCLKAIVWFSNLSWAFFHVGAIPIVWIAGFYAGLGLILCSWSWRKKAAWLTLLVAAAGVAPALVEAVAIRFENGQQTEASMGSSLLKATVIDVGQGTSVLVRFPRGEAMLVDGGGFFDDSFDVGRAVVAPFLYHLGIRRLDFVIASHDHPDHRNGLRFILSTFEVGQFWESGMTEEHSSGSKLAEIASLRGIPIRRLTEIYGEHSVSPCRIKVVHPSPEYVEGRWDRKDLNNVSLVLRIEHGDTSLILPGDIDQSVERHLQSIGGEPAGRVVLVSPHHGSERSNSRLLLDRLLPEAIIFSCGYENWFGFPASSVLERCAERNIATYRTDFNGAVHAVSDGREWRITAQSDSGTHTNNTAHNKRENCRIKLP